MIRLRVISLGAGLQSTTVALMAAHGEIGPMPDCAVFADTGNEKQATYRHLDWLETKLPFPVHRIRRFDIDLAGATIAHYRGEAAGLDFLPPMFSPQGMLPARCSKEWKTRAVSGWLRGQLGLQPRERMPDGERVEVWIGFSTDEASRMKPAELVWIDNRWPLIELRRHRQECAPWLARQGYPLPPRSACVHCAFQSDAEFADMEPHDFQAAVAFDEAARAGGNGTIGPIYVSKHMRPLADIDFRAVIAAKQSLTGDLFTNECEGMCGV